MRDLESLVGRKLDLLRWYAIWDDPMPPSSVRQSVERGRTPVLSILPKLRNGTKLPWAEVASGVHDARIREQAAGVRSLEVPLYLVFHHEPDYSPEYGSPADYRAAYRHYVEVFRAEGVTNVAWTWVMTPAAFNSPPTTPTKVGADDLYPGDDVVDWVALDPYNWNGCTTGVPQRWRTMAEIATPFRTWGIAHGKPLMLAEWNSFEDALDPERKANWYRETMSTLAAWPEVKAVTVFNTTGNCEWWITSSERAVAGFADAGARASAHGRASAWLEPSTLVGPSPLAVTFDASRSTGSGHPNGTGVTRWTLDFGDGTSTGGEGQPPSTIPHTYAGGSFRAVLTVTDAAGTTNVDRHTVTSAAAPRATTSVRNVTATSVELNAWVETGGIVGHAQMEWGPTTAYGSASPVMDLAAVLNKTHLAFTVPDLQPGSTYYWRLTVTTAAGSTVLDHTTYTAGPPTTTWAGASLVTTGSAEPYAGVHPHRAATTAYLEWGTTPALGQVTATQELTALTYEKTLRYPLTGLARGTTYWFRVVATNEHGTLVGPTKSFRTAP